MSRSRNDLHRQCRFAGIDGSPSKPATLSKEHFSALEEAKDSQYQSHNHYLFHPNNNQCAYADLKARGLMNDNVLQSSNTNYTPSFTKTHGIQSYPNGSQYSESVFRDDEFNTNGILSEIWGLSLEFPTSYVASSPKAQNEVAPGISPPLSPSPPLLENAIENLKSTNAITLGPPPGFSPGSINPDVFISKNQSNPDQSSDICKHSTSFALSKGAVTISKIILPLSDLKQKTDFASVISSFFGKKTPKFIDSTKTNVFITSKYLVIDLFGTLQDGGEAISNPTWDDHIQQAKLVLRNWLQNIGIGEVSSDRLLLDIASIRRELVFKLLTPTTSELPLNTQILQTLEKLGVQRLKSLSELTFVNIQVHKLQGKLILFGDPEGVDLVIAFLNLFFKDASQASREKSTTTTFVLQKPIHSTTILIPRCFHSPMIGIAGARLQSILKTFGNGSVRVSFPRYMNSPSWEVVISSNIKNIYKDSVADVRQALLESWRSIVVMSTRQRCFCNDDDGDSSTAVPMEFCIPNELTSCTPTGPGTPDCPGLLYVHFPNADISKEKIVIKNGFPKVHHCDFARIVRQTGVKLNLLTHQDSENTKDSNTSEYRCIEVSGLPTSHLLQIELMLSWINSARNGSGGGG